MTDGATFNNNLFDFPTDEGKTDENGIVTIQGKGKIRFISHCSDPQDTSTCALDLTFKDPRIVLNPKTGTGELYMNVHSKSYPSGQWEGPSEIKMADLSTTTANQSEKDGTVTWSNVAVNLSADGVRAFSNFYKENTPLDPISISYKGAKSDDALTGDYRVAESVNTNTEYSNPQNTVRAGNQLIHISGPRFGSGPAKYEVYDGNLKKLYSGELPTGASHFAVNPETGELAFVNEDTHKLERYTVGDKELTRSALASELDLSEDGTVLAMGYNPASNTWGVLTVDEQGGGAYATVNNENGATTKNKLPDPKSIDEKVASSPSVTSYYGDTYVPRTRLLAPLADGSFVYAPGTTTYADDENVAQKGQLLHFKDGIVSVVPGTSSTDKDNHLPSTLTTADGHIYRWNSFYGRGAKMQVLAYNNGEFSTVKETAAPPADMSEIESLFVNDDKVVAVDTSNGRLVWLNSDLSVAKEFKVANLRKTNNDNYNSLTMPNVDIIHPSMVERDFGAYEEIWLNRLATSKTPADPKPNPDPAPKADPKITIDTTEYDSTAPGKVKVKGTGYYGDETKHSVFVYISEKSAYPVYTADERVVPVVAFISGDQIKDGAFETELNIPADRLDANRQYVVATGATGKDVSDTQNLVKGLLETSTDLKLKAPAPAEETKVVADKTELDAAAETNSININGTGFVGESTKNGVIVGVYEADANGKATGDAIADERVWASDITEGRFSTTLDVPGAKLKADKKYVLVAKTGDEKITASTSLTVKAAPKPEPKPVPGFSDVSSSDPFFC